MDNIPGFYGKFPELGDFVNRRLVQNFVDPWDTWLQSAVATSRSQLGDSWLNSYLTSPVWKFALTPGLCGEYPWCGLVMPSVDRVGRYYPLTIACRLPLDANLMRVSSYGAAWFDQGEKVILSALNNGFNMDEFDNRVVALGSLDGIAQALAARTDFGFGQAWQIPQVNKTGSADFSELTHQLLAQRLGKYSIWWGAGSENMQASLLVCADLPAVDGYAAMLTGNWAASNWEQWVSGSELVGSG